MGEILFYVEEISMKNDVIEEYGDYFRERGRKRVLCGFTSVFSIFEFK